MDFVIPNGQFSQMNFTVGRKAGRDGFVIDVDGFPIHLAPIGGNRDIDLFALKEDVARMVGGENTWSNQQQGHNEQSTRKLLKHGHTVGY